MLIEIKATLGIELINTDHIVKAYSLKSGDSQLNLTDGSYTITKMSMLEIMGLVNGGV